MNNYLELLRSFNLELTNERIILLQNTIANLLPFQLNIVKDIIRIIISKNVCIVMADTGTGKTYMALAVAKELKKRPIIICRRAGLHFWQDISNKLGVVPYMIVNYETIRGGKMYSDTKRIKCPYLSFDKSLVDDKINPYTWELPNDAIFIFDEVHNCKDASTFQGKLLLSTAHLRTPLLLLSATICDKIIDFRIFTYILGLAGSMMETKAWIKNLSPLKKDMAKMLHSVIFPNYATRLSVTEIKDFPSNQISAEKYLMEESKEIDDAYNDIREAIMAIKNKEGDTRNALARIIRARQKIELLKINTFIDLAHEYLDNHFSVVIFVNFKKTLHKLIKYLDIKCSIHGDQTEEERQINITDFQENKERIMICNISAAGESLSLHDLHGFPRMSLISPTYSAIKFKQVCGRLARVGGKSAVIQKVVYCAKTIEEKMCTQLQNKLFDISQLNNGDVDPDNSYIIDGLDDITEDVQDETMEQPPIIRII